ncbi:MAG: hypothetical protein ABR863_02625 [Roseiarcus sp.]
MPDRTKRAAAHLLVFHRPARQVSRRGLLGRFGDETATERIVVVAKEHPPAAVAALRDVTGQVGNDETTDARHGRSSGKRHAKLRGN